VFCFSASSGIGHSGSTRPKKSGWIGSGTFLRRAGGGDEGATFGPGVGAFGAGGNRWLNRALMRDVNDIDCSLSVSFHGRFVEKFSFDDDPSKSSVPFSVDRLISDVRS